MATAMTVVQQPQPEHSPRELRFPPELLLLILNLSTTHPDLTDPKRAASLLSCSCVCRAWYPIALGLLYETVFLRHPHTATCFVRAIADDGSGRGRSITNGKNTPNSTRKLGECVRRVFLWTSIYKRPGCIGRYTTTGSSRLAGFGADATRTVRPSLLPRWRSREPLGTEDMRLCDDRFIDALVRHCPNLVALSIQNRGDRDAENAPITIVLPHVSHFVPTLFCHLRSLEVDADHSPMRRFSRHGISPDAEPQPWIVDLLMRGAFELPELENLLLQRWQIPDSTNMGDVWAWVIRVPALRTLTLLDTDLSTLPTDPASLLSLPHHPNLREIRFIRVKFPVSNLTGLRAILPPTITTIALEDCDFNIFSLPALLRSVAASLTDLTLHVPLQRPTPGVPSLPGANLGLQADAVDVLVNILSSAEPAFPVLRRIALRGSAFHRAQLFLERLELVRVRKSEIRILGVGSDVPGLAGWLTRIAAAQLDVLEIYLEQTDVSVRAGFLDSMWEVLPGLAHLQEISIFEMGLVPNSAGDHGIGAGSGPHTTLPLFISRVEDARCAGAQLPIIVSCSDRRDRVDASWISDTWTPLLHHTPIPLSARPRTAYDALETRWGAIASRAWTFMNRQPFLLRIFLRVLWVLAVLPLVIVFFFMEMIVAIIEREPTKFISRFIALGIIFGVLVVLPYTTTHRI